MAADYAGFFLNSKSTVVQLETVEISHPNFTQVYYCVRNGNRAGMDLTLETGGVRHFDYYPMKITSNGSRDDLDYGLSISFGDLGEVIPKELDAVSIVDPDDMTQGFAVKPIIRYRTYRSDILTEPLFGPIELEVVTFSFTKEGATFDATAPKLNLSSTGEVYSIDRFPMLRGLL